jgi:uncharacterized protein
LLSKKFAVSNSEPSSPDVTPNDLADATSKSRFELARASLRHSLSRYQDGSAVGLAAELKVLENTLEKLDQGIYCIAAFGLVSRGKSAVLNALMGEKVLEIGPLNGVTKFPRSVRWQPQPHIQIDLIDTPGLDEIDGDSRAQMAQQIAAQADLILFVIAGDITKLEYQALYELRAAHKPLILVFNKSDLYPEQERQAIHHQLQSLSDDLDQQKSEMLHRLLSADEVVMVAADPAPLQVRIEYPDGSIKNEWEQPAPNIAPLQQKILSLLEQEGQSLIAINALVQARSSENNLAATTLTTMSEEASKLIWRFAQYKALAVTLNPIVFFDVLGGMFVDLVMVRSLAKLYNLPITTYETGQLFKGVLFSGGSLLLVEIFTALTLGIGKSDHLLDIVGLSWADVPGYVAGGAIQGAIAGYGAYAVGQAARKYLAEGNTWGKLGANTVMREILQNIDSETIMARLREELIAPLSTALPSTTTVANQTIEPSISETASITPPASV